MPGDDENTVAEFRNEQTRVFAHRRDRFERMRGPAGEHFTEYAAVLLAQTTIDVLEVERMLKQGCPPDLILRIEL